MVERKILISHYLTTNGKSWNQETLDDLADTANIDQSSI